MDSGMNIQTDFMSGDLPKIYHGDALGILKTLPDCSMQCCVTSPPYYGLRDYGTNGQIGLEETPRKYVEKLVEVFREVRRILKDNGTLWLNLGDTYSAHKDCKSISDSLRLGGKSEMANVIEKGKSHSRNTRTLKLCGLKNKDLIGIPWMVAFALRDDGWYLRQDIIWAKPNPMPESVTDRCTKSHEYIFLLSKSERYFYDAAAILEEAAYDGRKDTIMKGSEKYANGFIPVQSYQTVAVKGHERWPKMKDGKRYRNKRSAWSITTKPFKGAHFAVFPPEIPELCIKAGSKPGDVVIDPFMGTGTTLLVASRLSRKSVGIEINTEYIKIAEQRLLKGK
jgi:DNA modification methylase